MVERKKARKRPKRKEELISGVDGGLISIQYRSMVGGYQRETEGETETRGREILHRIFCNVIVLLCSLLSIHSSSLYLFPSFPYRRRSWPPSRPLGYHRQWPRQSLPLAHSEPYDGKRWRNEIFSSPGVWNDNQKRPPVKDACMLVITDADRTWCAGIE